jgi:hypothetical protein
MSPIENIVHEIVVKALEQRLPSLVHEAVAAAVAGASREDPDELVRADEAARLLSLSEAALRKRAARGDLPVRRLGRALRFRRGDLTALRNASASK